MLPYRQTNPKQPVQTEVLGKSIQTTAAEKIEVDRLLSVLHLLQLILYICSLAVTVAMTYTSSVALRVQPEIEVLPLHCDIDSCLISEKSF